MVPVRAPAFFARGVALNRLPQIFVERQAGIERADLGLDGVVRRAQFRRGGDAFQMPDHAHGVIELFGHRVERMQRLVARDGFVQALLCVSEQLIDGGFDVGGLDFVEGDAKGDFEQRIHLLLL